MIFNFFNVYIPNLEVPDRLQRNDRRSGSTSDRTEFGSDQSQPISKLPPLKWQPMNVEGFVMTCMASGKGVFDNCMHVRLFLYMP